jgi:LysM repeat protein
MGQLERYGLYVLCLVIFLILGVAIWGTGPDQEQTNKQLAAINNDGRITAPDRVMSKDDHRRDIEEFSRAQERGMIGRQKSAEDALFQKARAKTGEVGRAAPSTTDPSKRQDAAPPNKDPARTEPPPTPPKSAPPGLIHHKIEDRDSFASLAQHYLGSEGYYTLIQAANPKLNPLQLKIGQVVVIPARPTAGRKSGGSAAHGMYLVKSGESPWLIARNIVGAAKATEYANRIMKLNKITDAQQVDAGVLLRLPER